MNDADRQYNTDAMQQLAELAEEKIRAAIDVARLVGVRGVSSPIAHLWYLNPATFFIIPFVHMAVHGVFKDFLRGIVAKQQRKLKKRKAAASAAPGNVAGLAGSNLSSARSNKRRADDLQQQDVTLVIAQLDKPQLATYLLCPYPLARWYHTQLAESLAVVQLV